MDSFLATYCLLRDRQLSATAFATDNEEFQMQHADVSSSELETHTANGIQEKNNKNGK